MFPSTRDVHTVISLHQVPFLQWQSEHETPHTPIQRDNVHPVTQEWYSSPNLLKRRGNCTESPSKQWITLRTQPLTPWAANTPSIHSVSSLRPRIHTLGPLRHTIYYGTYRQPWLGLPSDKTLLSSVSHSPLKLQNKMLGSFDVSAAIWGRLLHPTLFHRCSQEQNSGRSISFAQSSSITRIGEAWRVRSPKEPNTS